jgi:hypothetical protein
MGKYTAEASDHLIVPAIAGRTSGRQQLDRLMGRPRGPLVPVRLIIDTGSKRSTLTPAIIAQLSPSQGGDAQLETSLTTASLSLFWVRLEFPDTPLALVSELAVARVPMPTPLQSFHGVIGRDLLCRWDYLLYQGLRKRFSIRDIPSRFFTWLLWR